MISAYQHYSVVCEKRLLWESPHQDLVQKCSVVPLDSAGESTADDEVAVVHNKLKLSKCFLCKAVIPIASCDTKDTYAKNCLFNALQTILHYSVAHLEYLVRVTVVEVPKSSAASTPSKQDHSLGQNLSAAAAA